MSSKSPCWQSNPDSLALMPLLCLTTKLTLERIVFSSGSLKLGLYNLFNPSFYKPIFTAGTVWFFFPLMVASVKLVFYIGCRATSLQSIVTSKKNSWYKRELGTLKTQTTRPNRLQALSSGLSNKQRKTRKTKGGDGGREHRHIWCKMVELHCRKSNTDFYFFIFKRMMVFCYDSLSTRQTSVFPVGFALLVGFDVVSSRIAWNLCLSVTADIKKFDICPSSLVH